MTGFTEKQRKALLTAGVTAAVYLSFKFISASFSPISDIISDCPDSAPFRQFSGTEAAREKKRKDICGSDWRDRRH